MPDRYEKYGPGQRAGAQLVANRTMGLTQQYDHKVAQIDQELVASASPLITEFVSVLRNMHDKIGNTDLGCEPEFPQGIKVGRPLPQDIATIQTAVTRRDDRLAKITAAIPQVEAMRFEALPERELTARLNALRRVVGE